jgi:simple sugar transport system permease protein
MSPISAPAMLTKLIPGTNPTGPPASPPPRGSAAPHQPAHQRFPAQFGAFVALLSCLVFWFIIEKTKLGFELRATGLNKDAARYAGINVTKGITSSMIIAGAFAGLAGAVVALGSFSYGRVLGGNDNYGFNGKAVALVGNNTAGGTMIAAAFECWPRPSPYSVPADHRSDLDHIRPGGKFIPSGPPSGSSSINGPSEGRRS